MIHVPASTSDEKKNSAPTLRRRLQRRGALFARLRAFMGAHGITEVDTPLVRPWPAPDAQVQPVPAGAGQWLQASPEAAMKTLLAAGSGPVYQLGHVFRADERGRLHACEFTLLEWYRPGFDEFMLMHELGALLIELGLDAPQRMSYALACTRHCGFNPHEVSDASLQDYASGLGCTSMERTALLDFILATQVFPALGHETPVLLTDFPVGRTELAATSMEGTVPVARRFELFIQGMEIANGCRELVEPQQLGARLEQISSAHAAHSGCPVAVDQELQAAAQAGIPACAGIALGVDRLCMVLDGVADIEAVLCMPTHA